MMLIGIDGNEANVDQRVGVHQYSYEILWGFYRLLNKEDVRHKFIIFLKNPPKKDLPKETENWQYEVLPGKGFWILSRLLPRLMFKQKPDVLFAPSHYLPPLTGLPKVCTIHDLGYLEFSGQFKRHDFWQLKYWTAISIFISKYIISVSNSTKKDIVRHYPKASKKIIVTHHGYDKKRFNTEISENDVRRVKKLYKISSDYILFLGTLKPSKNIEGLLEAFDRLVKKNEIENTVLVIAGKKGWLFDSIFQKTKSLKSKNLIKFTGYIDEKDKPALIKGAKMFVLPSFWEGFGMDILKSLACGTPVVISDVASLPEVAGKAGTYIKPHNISSIEKGIRKVLKLPQKEYNNLVDKGIQHVKDFSWEKAAKNTLKVIEKAVN